MKAQMHEEEKELTNLPRRHESFKNRGTRSANESTVNGETLMEKERVVNGALLK